MSEGALITTPFARVVSGKLGSLTVVESPSSIVNKALDADPYSNQPIHVIDDPTYK